MTVIAAKAKRRGRSRDFIFVMPEGCSEDPRRNEKKRRDRDSFGQCGISSRWVMPEAPVLLPLLPQRMQRPHQDDRHRIPENSTATKKVEGQGTPLPACDESPATLPSENCQSSIRANSLWPTWRGRIPEDQEISYTYVTQHPLRIPQFFFGDFPGAVLPRWHTSLQ